MSWHAPRYFYLDNYKIMQYNFGLYLVFLFVYDKNYCLIRCVD